MISPKTQYSLKNAKSYFEEHLSVGDYYSEDEKIAGEWCGKGAEKLGLAGVVKADDFLKLCDNLDPRTGHSLTVRKKTTRREVESSGRAREVANRRVFYDFTISPPKSVSIVALLAADARIVDAHERALRVALVELEKFAATRVHARAKISDRATGNIVAAIFRHDTSRALDPHLHGHCILFNATFDIAENRWKALQNYDMLRAQKYVENVYYHELARELRAFGYEIENSARGDFEIKSVSRELCERFSKRHREINERTRELLDREPALASGNVADVREHVAHDERSRKIKDVATERLRRLWSEQISDEENASLANLLVQRGQPPNTSHMAVSAALAWAEDHLFDRKSVVNEHEVWRFILERTRGEAMTLAEVHAATAAAEYLRDGDAAHRLTTHEVMSREWEIVCRAKDGIGTCAPVVAMDTSSDENSLDEAQRKAVAQILSSRDFVTLFRGGAGTGKSFALREVDRRAQQAGHQTCVIAPQRQQVRDLERDGFVNAATVSEFLTRKEMRTGAVVIVDEAGQLGARQMLELLTFVKANRGRVILSGDTRQHGAVEASDALRAIERYAGLRAAELNDIRRQDPTRGETDAEKAWIAEYKRAVEAAASGSIAASFDRLENAGAVVECTLANQHERLAEEYLRLAAAKYSTVVVSQTWSEIHKVNEHVRAGLQKHGLLGRDEWRVTTLQNIDLTKAQKRDARFHPADSTVVFNRNAGGFRKGQSGKLLAVTERGIVVEGHGKVRTLPFSQLDHVTVCRQHEITLASGDRMQLKANAKTASGERIANGELVVVKQVEPDGGICLEDGRVLPTDYRQFVRGYAVTSYGSQGKTVDHVLFSDSAVKAATNAQQWYVTISRGRRGIRIFTADKAQLRESVARSGARPLALDMLRPESVARGRFARWLGRGRRGLRNAAVTIQRHVAIFRARRGAKMLHEQNAVSLS
jgi:conjugative relaxase-like TrwC/TraI family protein